MGVKLYIKIPEVGRKRPPLHTPPPPPPVLSHEERVRLYARRARGYAFMSWLFAAIAIFATFMSWVYDK